MTESRPAVREELVERLKAAVERTAHVVNDYGTPLLDNPEEVARACLSAIEAQGMVIVPRPEDDPVNWWRTCSCMTCQNRRMAEATLTALERWRAGGARFG